MNWDALTQEQIKARVFEALARNRSYHRDVMLGVPGSFLDREVFPAKEELAQYPLLATFIENPNHIGCHTVGSSEPAFSGTHALEREVIEVCAAGILKGEAGRVDGYVASGGTESNIQALWTYRNTLRGRGVTVSEIGVLCSEDTHYSIPKGADLLGLSLWTVPVEEATRRLTASAVQRVAEEARAAGVRWLIVVLNMGTTMFGSIDDADEVLPVLEALNIPYFAHVDAAFGGFVYPLTSDCKLDFRDPRLSSVTLDAHKMLQAPYGTGIHLIRKGYIESVRTSRASYVPGLDCTLSGSRSGMNAVSVWMILMTYGRAGGEAFCRALVERTDRLCVALTRLGVPFFRQPGMNVVTIRAEAIAPELADAFMLVPDTHAAAPGWYKIVVMDHVTDAQLEDFVDQLS